MRDGLKLSLVAVGVLLVAGYFLGHGLTADNYAYFLSSVRRRCFRLRWQRSQYRPLH